jgi:hypothetical protein
VHRHLKWPKKYPQPFELTVAHVCRAYQVMPTRAMWEIEHDPDGMVFTVMAIWAYERAKADVDQATKANQDLPTDAMAQLVIDHEAAIAVEEVQNAIREALETPEDEDDEDV